MELFLLIFGVIGCVVFIGVVHVMGEDYTDKKKPSNAEALWAWIVMTGILSVGSWCFISLLKMITGG